MKLSIKKITFSTIAIGCVIAIGVPIGIYSSRLISKNNNNSNIENKPYPGIRKYQDNNISIDNQTIKSSVKNGVFYLNFNFNEEKQTKLTSENYTTFIIESSSNLDKTLLSNIKSLKINLNTDYNKIIFNAYSLKNFINLKEIIIKSNKEYKNNFIQDIKNEAFPISIENFDTNLIYMPFSNKKFKNNEKSFSFNEYNNLRKFNAYIKIDENDKFYNIESNGTNKIFNAISSEWSIPNKYFESTKLSNFKIFAHLNNYNFCPNILIKSNSSFINSSLLKYDNLWLDNNLINQTKYVNNFLIYKHINYESFETYVNKINNEYKINEILSLFLNNKI